MRRYTLGPIPKYAYNTLNTLAEICRRHLLMSLPTYRTIRLQILRTLYCKKVTQLEIMKCNKSKNDKLPQFQWYFGSLVTEEKGRRERKERTLTYAIFFSRILYVFINITNKIRINVQSHYGLRNVC